MMASMIVISAASGSVSVSAPAPASARTRMISSGPYGPEEIMRVLALAGAGALTLTLPLAALITIMLAIIAYGVVRTALGTVPHFEAPAAWSQLEQGGQVLGLFLILRAFSQGA